MGTAPKTTTTTTTVKTARRTVAGGIFRKTNQNLRGNREAGVLNDASDVENLQFAKFIVEFSLTKLARIIAWLNCV